MRLLATNISCKPVSRCCSSSGESENFVRQGRRKSAPDGYQLSPNRRGPFDFAQGKTLCSPANRLMIRVHSCGLKLVRLPLSLAATLAALPSISEIPFLD